MTGRIINGEAMLAHLQEADCDVEVIVWHKPATRLPADSIDVLILIHEGDYARWARGRLDGDQLADSDGMPLSTASVTAWAEPQGPT